MSQTVQTALIKAQATLRDAGVSDPVRDARLLMGDALEIKSGRLTLHLGDDLPAESEASKRFENLIHRRAKREPVSHLLGRRAFYGRDFQVTPDVLDPRPETETLIEVALSKRFERVLDLGTGSGCILLSLLADREAASGVGTDVSDDALKVAQENAKRLRMSDRAQFERHDWFDGVLGKFDLIVSNPPYITRDAMEELEAELAHEPRLALTDEGDGLSNYRILTSQAQKHLVPGGRLIVEIGWDQATSVRRMFDDAGFEDVTVTQDLNGHNRIVSGVFVPQTG